jgi:hypothetical protein
MSDDQSIMSSVSSSDSTSSFLFNTKDQPNDYSCEFKLIQSDENYNRAVHFVTSSIGEKQSWCGDISQVKTLLNAINLDFF